VDESVIRLWRKQKVVLQKLPVKCKARRGSSAKWPALERELRQCVIDKRSLKARVTTTAVRFVHAILIHYQLKYCLCRLQAQTLAQLNGIQNFTGSNGWYGRFMKRTGLSVRCRTSVGQPLPDDWTTKLELFRAYVAEKKSNGSIKPENIFNMDEVPCQFDMVGSRTVAEGKKTLQ
jgi:hypothetical protein